MGEAEPVKNSDSPPQISDSVREVIRLTNSQNVTITRIDIGLENLVGLVLKFWAATFLAAAIIVVFGGILLFILWAIIQIATR